VTPLQEVGVLTTPASTAVTPRLRESRLLAEGALKGEVLVEVAPALAAAVPDQPPHVTTTDVDYRSAVCEPRRARSPSNATIPPAAASHCGCCLAVTAAERADCTAC
jgi:hypothetical protein